MNYSKEQEIVNQIKAFLNSSDLTNNQRSYKLYEEYFALCEKAKKRLDTCNEFLKKKLKSEVLAEVNKRPDLQEVISILNFPEKDLFLDLCDLYDWPAPPALSASFLNQLQDVSQTYQKMRYLLEEYRTISRSNLHHDKLILLRSIIKNDPQNSEWLKTIKDVEVLYLKELLDRAKNDILNEEFEDLRKIQSELTEEHWYNSIPAAALEKIDRVLKEYELKKNKEDARDLLFKIDSAYSSHDFSTLQIHLEDWKYFCHSRNYIPEGNESRQVREADDFLKEHKKEVAKQLEFDRCLELLVKKIENRAPIDAVEQDFVHLQSLELPIPDYLEISLDQYREDAEHENRMRAIGKGIKTFCITAIILAALLFAGYLTINIYTQKQKEKTLKELIANGKFEEAKKMYDEIYQKNPSLALSPGVKAQKLILDKWEQDEKKRKQDFEEAVSGIRKEVKKESNPDIKKLKVLIESVKKFAKSEKEKMLAKELEGTANDSIKRYQFKQLELFYEKFRIAGNKRNNLFTALENGADMETIEKLFTEFESAANACKNIQDVTIPNEEKDLLDVGKVRNELESYRVKYKKKKEFRTSIMGIGNSSGLADLLAKYQGDSDLQFETGALLKDLNVLTCIEKRKVENDDMEHNSFFRDLQISKENRDKLELAHVHLRDIFGGATEMAMQNLMQIVFQPDLGKSPVYLFYKNIDSSTDNIIKFKDTSGSEVTIKELSPGRYEFVRGNENDTGTIVFPEKISQDSPGKKAVHLELWLRIYENSKRWKTEDVILGCIDNITMIINEKYCIPFWKAQLIIHQLDVLEKLTPSDKNSPTVELKKRLAVRTDSSNMKFDDEDKNQQLDDDLKKISLNKIKNYVTQWLFDKQVRDITANDRYCYLGVILEGQIPKEFTGASENGLTAGDIFCLTEDRNNRIHVGRFDAKGIHIFPKYQKTVINRVLFTSVKYPDIMKLKEQIKKTADQENLKVNYPDFWPVNQRGN